MRRPSALHAAAALAATLLAGCSSWSSGGDALFGLVTPYRIDIQQGNVITQEQLQRIKPGMTRLQVRDALGTPLLTDAFHTDRWDYIFTLRQGSRPLQRRNVVLVFDGETLRNIEAPELPSESEFLDSISRGGRVVAASKLELTPEQIKALPIPPKTTPAPAEPATPAAPRSYPPLEPS